MFSFPSLIVGQRAYSLETDALPSHPYGLYDGGSTTGSLVKLLAPGLIQTVRDFLVIRGDFGGALPLLASRAEYFLHRPPSQTSGNQPVRNRAYGQDG